MQTMPSAKATSTMTLPSGADIDINRPDFARCRSVADFIELRGALQEKIIDIELQIDLFHSDPEAAAAVPRDWLPRASAALKWAKLHRDECQSRQGYMNSLEKARRQTETTQVTVELLKALMPPEAFESLMEAAQSISRERLARMLREKA